MGFAGLLILGIIVVAGVFGYMAYSFIMEQQSWSSGYQPHTTPVTHHTNTTTTKPPCPTGQICGVSQNPYV